MKTKLTILFVFLTAIFVLSGCQIERDLLLELDENPTTGYRWEYVLEGDVQVVKDNYIAPDKTGLVGAGGTRVFEFKAPENKEECSVKLYYRRSWETFPDSPDCTYVFSGDGWVKK